MGNLIAPAAVNISTGGLRRHQRHRSKSETQFEKDTTQQIFQETISDLSPDECYPDEIKI